MNRLTAIALLLLLAMHSLAVQSDLAAMDEAKMRAETCITLSRTNQ